MISEKKAFTLIELLVTMAIFSILVAGASWFIISSSRDGAVIWEQLFTQNQGKKTIEQVMNYVRKAETSSAGAYALVTTEPNNFVFYADTDGDSLVEKVQFWLDNNTLKETITKPSSTAAINIYDSGTSQTIDLADNVINSSQQDMPVFLYYDQNYNGTQSELIGDFNLTDVRMVKVQLELEKDPTKSPVPLYVEGTALIRNVKTN